MGDGRFGATGQASIEYIILVGALIALLAGGISIADAQVANQAPVIMGSPPDIVRKDNWYIFVTTAYDMDGDRLTFSVANEPPWASIHPQWGWFGGTPRASDVGTYSNIVISVTDGQQTVSLAPFSIEVVDEIADAGGANRPPRISGTPDDWILEGDNYVFIPEASDRDSSLIWFKIENRPPWARFNHSSGMLQGVPDADDRGSYGNIRIGVSDGNRTAWLEPFALEVMANNIPPTISGAPSSSVTQNEPYQFQPEASDADEDPLSFTIENQPPWSNFDDATGELWGTPGADDLGLYEQIRIRVSDGTATVALSAFDIEVLANATASAFLTWTPPTENEDGSELQDLAGYLIYAYKSGQAAATRVDELNAPGADSYLFEGLSEDFWEFAASAVDGSGQESELTARVGIDLRP